MKRLIFPVIIVILNSITISGQNPIPKRGYFHLVGTINEDIQVTMELIKLNDSLYADYTCHFTDYNQKAYNIYYGSSQQLSGKMFTNNNFWLKKPISEKGPDLQGKFVNSSELLGTWENSKGQKHPFKLNEKYPEGTVQFNLFYDKVVRKLVAKPKSPEAKIQLLVLLPAESSNVILSDTLRTVIQKCFFGNNTLTASPEVLIGGMKDVFFENYTNSNESLYKEMPDGGNFSWELLKYMHIVNNEGNLLTFSILSYAFTGGAHGLETQDFFSIDLLTGKIIHLEDILKPDQENELNNLLTNKLRQMIGISGTQKLTESGYFVEKVKANENFYLTGNGLGFFFNHYELAPYSFGFTDIFLTFNELEGLIK